MRRKLKLQIEMEALSLFSHAYVEALRQGKDNKGAKAVARHAVGDFRKCCDPQCVPFDFTVTQDGKVTHHEEEGQGEPETTVSYRGSLFVSQQENSFRLKIMKSVDGVEKPYIVKQWNGTAKKPIRTMRIAQWIKEATAHIELPFLQTNADFVDSVLEVFVEYGIPLQVDGATATPGEV